MEELAKVRRVAAKRLDGAPHETLIVIDATTGQNGLRQARPFADAVEVTGVVLTKLDGTAKGGIALAIAGELGIPVKLIGVGGGARGPAPVRRRGVRPRRCSASTVRPVAGAARPELGVPAAGSKLSAMFDRCPTASRRPSPTSARAAS